MQISRPPRRATGFHLARRLPGTRPTQDPDPPRVSEARLSSSWRRRPRREPVSPPGRSAVLPWGHHLPSSSHDAEAMRAALRCASLPAQGVTYPDSDFYAERPSGGHWPVNLAEVFRHELAHVAIHDALGAPRCLGGSTKASACSRPEAAGRRLESLWLATVSGNLLPLAGLERLSGEHRHWPTRRVPISSDTCCAWRTASAFACSRPRRLGRSRCGGAQVSYGVSLAEAQTSGSPLRSPVFPYGHSYSGAVALVHHRGPLWRCMVSKAPPNASHPRPLDCGRSPTAR